MKSAIALLFAVLAVLQVVVQVSATTASSIEFNKGTLVNNPKCCYKCNGCYDNNNQRRYFQFTQFAAQTYSSLVSNACKKGNKCPVQDITKTVTNSYFLKSYGNTQNKYTNGGVKTIKSFTARFYDSSSLAIDNSGLNLTHSLIELIHPNTYMTVASGSFSLLKSEIRGYPKYFSLSKTSTTLDRSKVSLCNSVVNIDSTRLTIRNSDFLVTSEKGLAPPPPNFVGANPFLATGSYIDIKSGALTFNNVKDAYFVYSTIAAENSQIVLINSNVRFIDGNLNVTNSAIKLLNSSLLLSFAKLQPDKYVAFVKGNFKGLPKSTFPFYDLSTSQFTATGTGLISLKSKNT